MKRLLPSFLSLLLSLSLSMFAGALSCGSNEKDVITGGTGGKSGGTGGTAGGTGGKSGTGGTAGGTGGGTGGGTTTDAGSNSDGAGPDATMTNGIWNPATAKSIQAEETSGFGPPGAGFCTTFTVDVPSKLFTAGDCGAATPKVSRTLTAAEFAELDASMSMLKLNTVKVCGADKGVMEVVVTTTDGKMTRYKDSFYSCQGGADPYVDNIDQLMATLNMLAK